jgi:hypothetical protein
LKMLNFSAAALESGHGRAHRVLGGVAVVILFLTISAGSAGRASTAATPLVQVTPTELRLSQPLAALAAGGGRAAFAFCNQLLGVWRPGATGVTRLGPLAQWTCPPPRGLERTYSLAFAGDRVAWSAEAGGNIVTNLLFLVVLGQPHVMTMAADISYCCRSVDPDRERMGDVYGDGGFIAFSSRVKCSDQGAPGCPTSVRTLISQTVWRLRRPPFQGQCVTKSGPCVQLATRNDVLQPLSVDSGRVAVRRVNGALEIRKPNGALVRQFPGLAGLTRGAELIRGRLVVLVPGQLREYKLSTGALLRTRPLPNVSSGGVCGMPPCPTVALQMVDAARGLVAYTLSGKLHLLRLRDGRDRVVATATDARFGDRGLFYAFTKPAPWVSRIRFVRWAALPVQP